MAPGEAAPGGIDPRPALAALMPQTLPLRWVQIDQTTTLKLTTATTNKPSHAHLDCDDKPTHYEVPVTILFETADGRLSVSAETGLFVDGNGALVRPATVSVTLPASIFAGADVVSAEILDPLVDSGFVRVTFELVAAGAGVAYGDGSLVLTGGDTVTLAVVEVSQ
ncbi:hypothetical protein WME90_37285 [Sorangium sp. So ce375]|uniref:hypothetical protein n=1 Tax=Sorangium sp. So ce375 TaxID=3133306 RepID=UPI003F5BCB4A